MDEQPMQQATAESLGPSMIKQEKYWKDLSIEEKIERMRALVKSLVSTNDRQRRELNEIQNFIWEHSHEENGEVVVKVTKREAYKLTSHNFGIEAAAESSREKKVSDEVYI